jgi:hypothetical protein
MPTSTAQIDTELASRYLGQLCNHFKHKVPVQQDGARGRIEFSTGICTLQAETGLLILHAQSETDDALVQLEAVVARHLERFAFRDKPEISWQRQPTVAGARSVT